jgi:hypothetical protein
VRGGISEEDACRGARGELMFGGCLHVGVTEAPKNTQMVIGWWLIMQTSVCNVMLNGGGWAPIMEVAGRQESLGPICEG